MESTNMNALGRPVMLKDIAEKLGVSKNTVKSYLNPNYLWPNGATCQLVRKTALEMGYSPKEVKTWGGKIQAGKKKNFKGPHLRDIADACGASVCYVSSALAGHSNSALAQKIRNYAAMIGYKTRKEKKEEKEKARPEYWHNTPFKTREELVAYFLHLRKEGYGNTEIARKAGVARQTVQRNIGPEPPSLAKHTRAVAQKLRAQKNAARRSYLRNQPIAEYNMQVAKHNELKAKVAAMEAELTAQKPAIEKAAAEKVSFPLLNLSQLSPTALQ